MAQELKWNWVYYPYLDAPNKQKESALKAGYIKVVIKDEVEKLIAEKDKTIAELKAKLESVQASMDADLVDAGMENRRLKRALWLTRAERASDRARIFYFNDLETMLDIDGFSYDRKKKKGCKKLTALHWRIIWLKVERKCRAKAEEYK